MSIDDVVAQAHVIVCCGTGGVGKTTTAAVLALAGARQGRNAVVVTIDPAKRLADTLGLEELGDAPREIDPRLWAGNGNAADASGRLSALMLDTRATFDALVGRYSANQEQVDRILANRFYRNVAGALSGTQEYMAAEKLYELHDSGEYDLIVVDTPPTRHALDFLDAPARLTRLLDNRVFRFLMVPTRTYMRAAGFAVQGFLRAAGRAVGTEVIDDIVAFFRAFEGMEQGFRQRASEVTALLGESSTAFVLVTSPRRDATDETEFFAARLGESGMHVAALIVNRVHPTFDASHHDPAELRAEARTIAALPSAAAARLGERYENLADYSALATRERDELARAGARIGADCVAYVPSLAHDVADFAALRAVEAALEAPMSETEPPESNG
jgi:anion-transporting  ArsA/GET3 family ATPase